MAVDTRNVIDRYKSWETDLIRLDLQNNALPYATLMENWVGDYNFSGMVRNSNAFAAREVFYLASRKKWDIRGAVGTHKYTLVNYLNTYDQVAALKERYRLIAIDNCEASIPRYSITNFDWPDNTLMIFGEEGIGLTKEILALCESMVYIPQLGSVRSLNVACASAICCFDYVSKKGKV